MTFTKREEKLIPNSSSSRLRSATSMSLSYSDFHSLAHSDTEDNGDPLNPTPLPNEFQVIEITPVPLNPDPEGADGDFILIAEFSELEGPVPLCTIPDKAAQITDINLNSLAVHLMSTDYQVNTVGQFKICQDTQVMRENVFPQVHVFMQYFTLLDIKARGFVRPFCFGYITKDHIKLKKMINRLMHDFDKITEVLKYINRTWFSEELRQYIEKLTLAKEKCIQELTPKQESKSTEGNDNSQDEDEEVTRLNQIAFQFSETQNVLQQVKHELANKELGVKVQQLSEYFQALPNLPNFKITLEKLNISSKHPNYNSETTLFLKDLPLLHPLREKKETQRPLTCLGQFGTALLFLRLARIQMQFKQDIMYLEIGSLTVDFLLYCEIFQTARQKEIEYEQRKQQEKENVKVAKDNVEESVESNVSDETVQAQLEEDDDYELIPSMDQETLAMQMGFSFDDLYLTKHYGTFYLPSTDKVENVSDDIRICDVDDVSTCLKTIHSGKCLQIGGNNESRSSSLTDNESDIEVLASEHLNGTTSVSTTMSSFNGEGSVNVENHSEEISDSNNSSFVFPTTSTDILITTSSSTTTSTTASVKEETIENNTKANSSSTLLCSPSTRLDSVTSSQSDDLLSELASSSSTATNQIISETIKKQPWWTTLTKHIIKPGEPGYGILKFFTRHHKAAVHILYSILLRRPIIICGTQNARHRICRILRALIPCVPTKANETEWNILYWHQGILVPTHLETYKLIGLCIPERLHVHDLLKPSDQNNVTIYDIESKKLMGPAYSGKLLETLNLFRNNQTYFVPNDEVFIFMIGAVLVELDCKVYTYKAMSWDDERNKKKVTPSKICKTIKLKDSDAEIVKSLSSAIESPLQTSTLFSHMEKPEACQKVIDSYISQLDQIF